MSDFDLLQLRDVSEEAWVVLEEEEIEIKKAFEKHGKTFKEWAIKINFGIKTSFNEAFIINQEKRNELVKEDSKSKDIIKPILKGREIQKYYAEWADDYVISMYFLL